MANKKLYRKSFSLPNGKRKWVSAKSAHELEQKIMDLRLEANMGVDVTNNITFGEYALRWYRVCKEPNIGANSQRSILGVLNVHLLPYLSGYPMRAITQVQIQYVFNHLIDKSRSLNAKVKMVLSEIFDNAIANRLISMSPMVGLSVRGKAAKKKNAITEEEERSILQSLASSNAPEDRRAYLFALLGFKTGLRRGELCALMLSDFDLQNKTLTVKRAAIWPTGNDARISDSETQTKTPAALRTVPIPDTALPAIREALQNAANDNSLYFFHGADGKMLSMTALRNLWKRVQRHSTVPFVMHEMRHTYCSRLIKNGLDIKTTQYFMGHSDPAMTLRIYSHFIKSEQFDTEAAKVRACL